MRTHIVLLILFFSLMEASVVYAGQDEYSDCILKYLKEAKLDAATDLIRNACYENYGGIFSPTEKVRKYNECLLEHLGGIESFHAAMEIRNACGSKYLR